MIKNKAFSIKEIVSQYLEQIDSFDKGFNGLNSILEINSDVITIVLSRKLNDAQSVRLFHVDSGLLHPCSSF